MLYLASAHAASLDNIEVGGPFGTPTTTDGTAAWWNPAGLAAGQGTRLHVEGAPTFATVTFGRADPHGGTDIYRLGGVVPFAGVATDLGVDGLGLGAAFALPFVRGGAEVDEPGSGAYAMRDGDSRAIFVLLGGGYEFADRVSVGFAGALVHTQWTARVSSDTMPDLDHAIEERGAESGYTDEDLESPEYAATLEFDALSDTVFSWSAGLRVKAADNVTIGVAYLRGAVVDNTGDVTITFGCPPEDDIIGRYGAENLGVCNTQLGARASVAYALPSRLHGGVAVEPTPALRLEAMGGWVQWSVYDDFDISVSEVEVDDEETAELIEQRRLWARANEDSGWAGIDVKGRPHDRWTVGGRFLYDGAAVPDEAMSGNNYDANAYMLTTLVAWRPVDALELGLSWTHHFLEERDVQDSGFSVTVEGEPTEDRWNYPHANGVYTGVIDRVGIAARASF